MAYNPYFPNFQPYMPQYQPQQQASIVCEWVQNESVAAAMPTPSVGVTGIYMDIAQPFVYKKEMGVDGKPLPMEKFRLIKETNDKASAPVREDDLKDYIRKDKIEDIVTEKLEDIVRDEVDRRISEMSFKPTRKSRNTED